MVCLPLGNWCSHSSNSVTVSVTLEGRRRWTWQCLSLLFFTQMHWPGGLSWSCWTQGSSGLECHCTQRSARVKKRESHLNTQTRPCTKAHWHSDTYWGASTSQWWSARNSIWLRGGKKTEHKLRWRPLGYSHQPWAYRPHIRLSLRYIIALLTTKRINWGFLVHYRLTQPYITIPHILALGIPMSPDLGSGNHAIMEGCTRHGADHATSLKSFPTCTPPHTNTPPSPVCARYWHGFGGKSLDSAEKMMMMTTLKEKKNKHEVHFHHGNHPGDVWLFYWLH